MGGNLAKLTAVAAALALAVILAACTSGSRSSGSTSRTCTVSHPTSSGSQLFLDPENDPNAVTMIPNGTSCTYLGSFTYTEAGVEIPMYKLSCSGKTGYMNRKFAKCP